MILFLEIGKGLPPSERRQTMNYKNPYTPPVQQPGQFQPQQPGPYTPQPPVQQQGYPTQSSPVQQPHAQSQAVPQPQQANQPSQQQPQQSQPHNSGKIAKINGKDKVIDFSDAVILAFPTDSAAIHGTGGKGHAPNSGIRINVCDFTKGTGDKSVTCSFNLDVWDAFLLHKAAGDAVSGTLAGTAMAKASQYFSNATGVITGWLQGSHQPTFQELASVQQTLAAGMKLAGEACWSFDRQKNNPYRKTEDGFVPVSTLHMEYNPTRNYQWTIVITNFEAPLIQRENGATAHDAKRGRNKKDVMFFATTSDLFAALEAVTHFIQHREDEMKRTIWAQASARREGGK